MDSIGLWIAGYGILSFAVGVAFGIVWIALHGGKE